MSAEPVLAATPAIDRKNLSIGYMFAATGAILFSMKAIIVKLAYGLDIDPETLLALRMGFSTILLAALILGERLSVPGIIGMALVFAGVGWFTLSERSR